MANFNVAAIESIAKTVSGVTRVFVEEITPEIGQVTIFFTRDDDDSIIPSASEIADVRAEILTIKPAHTSDTGVLTPTLVGITVNFVFTALTPNTSTMQSSIQASLELFFREETTVGSNLDQDAYRAAIFNTVDTSTGDVVTNFDLSTPVGDVTIQSGEIPVLGTVTFT